MPLRSVGGRLALALLLVVAGVLAIVYLIVVPSYQHLARAATSCGRSSGAPTRAAPSVPGRAVHEAAVRLDARAAVNARVVVFDLHDEPPALLVPSPTRTSTGDSTDVVNDPSPSTRSGSRRWRAGTVTRDGPGVRRGRLPVGASVVDALARRSHDQLQVVSVVRKRVLVAGAIATGFAVAARLCAARASSRGGSGGSRRRPSGSPPATSTSRSSITARTSSASSRATFERMRLRLAHLDRARGEFIANASHELRTPLFSLGGFLELLDDPELDEATREEFLGADARAGRAADEARDRPARPLAARRRPARASRASRSTSPSSPRSSRPSSAPRAATADHPLEVAPEPRCSRGGDAERVLQIGRILLENALVHTPPGTTVRVSAARRRRPRELTVEDDGPGIPRERAAARLRALLPPRRHAGLRQRPRAGDRAASSPS